jgi:nucleoside-diphosphate-sugar epimerase
MSATAFVTGGTGFVGGYLIDALRARGDAVRALVRPSGDRQFLEILGAEPVVGDLEQPDALAGALTEACAGCDVVYHAAARVDIVGTEEEFNRTTVAGTETLVAAARRAGVRRFVYVSSCGVYHPRMMLDGPISERTPVSTPPDWFRYGRAKLAAEKIVRERFGPPGDWVIIRLGYLYGARNRAMKQYLYPLLKSGYMSIVGKGDNELAMIHVSDAVSAIVACGHVPEAAGRILIAAGTERVTQSRYFSSLAQGLGLPPVRRHVPYKLAYFLAWLREKLNISHPAGDSITRAGVALTGLPQRIDCTHTQRVLNWTPRMPFDEGIQEACDWFNETHHNGES